jgi:hypothetical protein
MHESSLPRETFISEFKEILSMMLKQILLTMTDHEFFQKKKIKSWTVTVSGVLNLYKEKCSAKFQLWIRWFILQLFVNLYGPNKVAELSSGSYRSN